MKYALFFFLLLATNQLNASTHGFQSLKCDSVLGPKYLVEVEGDSVRLIEKIWSYGSGTSIETHERHVFSVDQCRFKPFSIDMKCKDGDATLSVALSEEKSSVSGRYHAVDFKVTGIEEMKSYRFETIKIDSGKSARCLVNDVFEVR